jgi:hypothetical protein
MLKKPPCEMSTRLAPLSGPCPLSCPRSTCHSAARVLTNRRHSPVVEPSTSLEAGRTVTSNSRPSGPQGSRTRSALRQAGTAPKAVSWRGGEGFGRRAPSGSARTGPCTRCFAVGSFGNRLPLPKARGVGFEARLAVVLRWERPTPVPVTHRGLDGQQRAGIATTSVRRGELP